MKPLDLANKLAKVDELETWNTHADGVEPSIKVEAYKIAEPMWVKRMLESGGLLVHPDVADQLRAQEYRPIDLQKRMIWASVIATDESPNSKERFYQIKEKLIKRYSRDWWEDVFQRKNHVFAAKERIKKSRSGPMISTFVENTHLGAACAQDELVRALRMIPKGEI